MFHISQLTATLLFVVVCPYLLLLLELAKGMHFRFFF